MPSVNLSPETYEKLVQLATRKGCTPDALVDQVVSERTGGSAGDWAYKLDAISNKPTHELSEEEINFDVDLTLAEVRANSRARDMSKEERLQAFDSALAEIRSGIPDSLTEQELTEEIDRAVAEARADIRARGY